jgi:hypothetical protein
MNASTEENEEEKTMNRSKNIQKVQSQKVIEIPTDEEERRNEEQSIENEHLKY